MYYSTATGYIIILSPLILLAYWQRSESCFTVNRQNYRENGIAYHLRKEKESNK